MASDIAPKHTHSTEHRSSAERVAHPASIVLPVHNLRTVELKLRVRFGKQQCQLLTIERPRNAMDDNLLNSSALPMLGDVISPTCHGE
jgi:hypothetical protein